MSAAVTPAQAAVIRVPADQPTIQAGIAAAAHGDTVQVAPGTYVENLNFLGKAIRVTSEQGPQVTIVDGNQAGSVVAFVSGEGPQSVLNGFTVRNGRAAGSPGLRGGGIRIENSSPTITGNIVTENTAGDGGGGISSSFGSPVIQGNTITNNGQITGWSGGVGGGAISIVGSSSAQILNNVISGNAWSASGGGITLFAASLPTVSNNLISGNTAFSQGGGIWIVNQSLHDHCNSSGFGRQCGLDRDMQSSEVARSLRPSTELVDVINHFSRKSNNRRCDLKRPASAVQFRPSALIIPTNCYTKSVSKCLLFWRGRIKADRDIFASVLGRF
jgi:parallel beta-helix repeat protein